MPLAFSCRNQRSKENIDPITNLRLVTPCFPGPNDSVVDPESKREIVKLSGLNENL